MSYGRHQSFYLKKHWINKGLKALSHNNDSVLVNKDSYKDLGIGKNMQQALRYWLEATNVVNQGLKDKQHELSTFGKSLEKHDPSCSRLFSMTLVHYFLVNLKLNDDPFSHSFHYFFKENEDYFIGKEKFKNNLLTYSEGQIAENTITRDIDCLIQTYTNDNKKHPEDKNVSLLADLHLIRKEKNYIVKSSLVINRETALAFYYSLHDNYGDFDYSIENVTKYIGSIFNFNRTQIIETIEVLNKYDYDIGLTRTNNLDYIDLRKVRNKNELLEELFGKVFDYEN